MRPALVRYSFVALLLMAFGGDAVAAELDCATALSAIVRLAQTGHDTDVLAAVGEARIRCASKLGPDQSARMWLIEGQSALILGAYDLAEQAYRTALDSAPAEGWSRLRYAALNGQALVDVKRARMASALKGFGNAAHMASAAKLPELAAQAYINAASAAGTANVPDTDYLNDAEREARAVSEAATRSFLLAAVGRRYSRGATNRPDRQEQAYRLLDEAAQLSNEAGDWRTESFALGYQGELYEQLGRTSDGLRLARRALFLAHAHNASELQFRWHWLVGRLLRAQGNVEQAIAQYDLAIERLRTVRAGLRHDAMLTFDPTETSPATLYFQLADMLLTREADPQFAGDHETMLRAARDAVELVKATELEDYFQDDCVANLTSHSVGVDNIHSDTAVFYPILFPDRLDMLVTMAAETRRYSAKVDARSVAEQIRTFRQLLEKRTTRQYIPQAQALYQLLFAPVADLLKERGIRTLVIVPDDELRLIPMSALHDGKQFLIESYAIAVTPGLTLTASRPLAPRSLDVLLAGVTDSVQGFAALPNVEQELKSVSTLFRSEVLKNQDFDVGAVDRALSDHAYNVVHFATHAQFGHTRADTFVLDYRNKITIDELEHLISKRRYADQPIELLTLSACQTAAGDERAALGLAGVAIKAGARSAVASLWFVNDAASSLLVTEFYRQLKSGGVSKAEALRRAQRGLIADPRYRHPGYWAPFLLIGNWL